MKGLEDVRFEFISHTKFYPSAFVETKRLEFETLTQGSMTVSRYKQKFRNLLKSCPNLISDDVSKKRRFLDCLIKEDIS